MSILEVTRFEGTAQILGAVRNVAADGTSLMIAGVDIDEAQRILNHLAIGLASVELPGAAKRSKRAAEPEFDQLAEAALKGGVSTEPKPEPAPKEKKSKAPPADDLPGTLGQNGKGPAQVKTEPASTPVASAGGNGDSALIEKLAPLSRMSDVVAALHEGGEDAQGIIEICKRLRPHVKAIGRLGSDAAIAERVPLLLESMAD